MKRKMQMKQSMVRRLLIALAVCAIVASIPMMAEAFGSSNAWAGEQVSSAMLDADVAAKPAKKVEAAQPTKSPTKAIKDLDAMLDDFKTGNTLTPEEEAHNREIKTQIIHGTFDIRELSRLALSKHWKALTQQQQDHFVDLMVSLLEEKALFSKEQSAAKSKQGGKYEVMYRGHKFISKDKQRSFVRTKVLIPSEKIDIDLNYKLKAKDGEWKIYDVIVDEASLVSNYKYQFNSIITKHSYDELVRRMTKKLDEIKADRSKSESKG